jgi:DNA-binding response OmpR family regulator
MGEAATARTAVVVEDDADIRNLLDAVLTQAGFEVFTAADGPGGVDAVRQHDPIVTTLDVSLPGMDGLEVARRIRTFSSTYIVMLTARSDEIDTLLGLEAGADDYVTKPFRPRELRARIEAMLRRPRALGVDAAASATPPAHDPKAAGSRETPDDDANWLGHDGLRVDPDARIVEVDGRRVELTRSEFELLLCVVENGRRVVTKNTLAKAIRVDHYESDYVSESERRSVEVHLANVRRKIGDDSGKPRWIETVRGVGYRLAG